MATTAVKMGGSRARGAGMTRRVCRMGEQLSHILHYWKGDRSGAILPGAEGHRGGPKCYYCY